MGFTGFTLVMPFLPLYIQQLGVTDPGEVALWSGVTLAVTPAIAALCAPLWGRIGDRFGNKVLVQRSLVAATIVMSAMAYATQPWHLLALRAIMGFFAGWGPLTIAMAALSAPPGRMAQAIGTVQTAHRIGPTVGPVLGGVLAPLVGIRAAFFVSAGFYVASLAGVTLLYREAPHQQQAAAAAVRRPWTAILALDNLLLLVVVIFGLQLVDRCFGPVLALHLAALGYAPESVAIFAGMLFSVLALSAAGGNQLASWLLARHTPPTVITAAALIAAVSMALLTVSEPVWAIALELAVVGLCIGLSMTTAFTAAGAVLPKDAHSTAFGFLTSASLAAVAVSPVVSGLTAGRSIRAVFVGGAMTLVVVAVLVRRLMANRGDAVTAAPTVEES